MWNMNDVIKIKYQYNYIFHIEFDDGVAGDIDFYEYLERGHIYTPLKEMELFKKATIDGGTISCSNGADIAPEALHEKILLTKRSNGLPAAPLNIGVKRKVNKPK